MQMLVFPRESAGKCSHGESSDARKSVNRRRFFCIENKVLEKVVDLVLAG